MRSIRLKSEDMLRYAIVAVLLGALVFVFVRFVYVPPLPTPIGQNCGTLSLPQATPVSADPATCLWNDYIECKTATLTYNYRGLDTSESHVIIVQRGSNGCTVTDTVERQNYNGVHTPTVDSYACNGMVPPQNGTFTVYGCGAEGNVTVFLNPG